MRERLLVEINRDELQDLIMDSMASFMEAFTEEYTSVPPQERYINRKIAAEIASVSVSTIDNWGREGKIERYHFGGSVRFHLPELLEYLKKQRSE